MDELALFNIYLLNLSVTVAMFIVLVFRAWIEMKNFKIMWKEAEWRRVYQAVSRVLIAERALFTRTEGGRELYNILCQIFEVKPRKAA